jgi:UDP-N-acetylglucosamine 4,6-dehydratase/5-epimerase
MDHNREFWNKQHDQDNQRTLSGCGFDATVDFLNVKDLIVPGMRVLEIGCGLGYVTQGFAEIAKISVLDISDSALDRVRPICESVYHINDVESLPTDYFDLIICHNVVQHVVTESLVNELKHAIRSLAPTGTFAIEYVWANGVEDNGADPDPAWATAGHLCRSDKFMIDLVNELGGTCKISRTNAVPNHRKINGLTVLHIQKSRMFDNKRVFISGATGSWGQTLVAMLLKHYDPKEIICFSRGELQQVLMQRRFQDPRLKFVIGDVRDYESVRFATKGVDVVFHLAALKHVPICEDHPQEAIKTNITGTTNIVNAAIENHVAKVIDVSTDKAVEPLNLYGMTKSVGEKLIIQGNDLSSHTKFVCIRGGNVMGSNGSVIPYFIEQIKSGGPITITDLEMTRFFLTLEEAILLLFKAAEASIGGETFVMNMPACYIRDVASVLMDQYGRVDIKEIGSKPGEKLDEMLISKHEALLSRCFDENYYVILPTKCSQELEDRYKQLPAFPHPEFSSRTVLMDREQIKDMLTKGGFL